MRRFGRPNSNEITKPKLSDIGFRLISEAKDSIDDLLHLQDDLYHIFFAIQDDIDKNR